MGGLQVRGVPGPSACQCVGSVSPCQQGHAEAQGLGRGWRQAWGSKPTAKAKRVCAARPGRVLAAPARRRRARCRPRRGSPRGPETGHVAGLSGRQADQIVCKPRLLQRGSGDERSGHRPSLHPRTGYSFAVGPSLVAPGTVVPTVGRGRGANCRPLYCGMATQALQPRRGSQRSPPTQAPAKQPQQPICRRTCQGRSALHSLSGLRPLPHLHTD